jgi:hypothetical protein
MTEVVSRIPYLFIEHAQVVSGRVVAYSSTSSRRPRSTGSRLLRARSSTSPVPCSRIMSDHTEQLEDLAKRIASAKEFL